MNAGVGRTAAQWLQQAAQQRKRRSTDAARRASTIGHGIKMKKKWEPLS